MWRHRYSVKVVTSCSPSPLLPAHRFTARHAGAARWSSFSLLGEGGGRLLAARRAPLLAARRLTARHAAAARWSSCSLPLLLAQPPPTLTARRLAARHEPVLAWPPLM
ncbi:hypothetical protein Dimus_002931, partial [Dionaea muscipula]